MNSMIKRTDEEWLSLIREWEPTGKSVKSWCRERGIVPSTMCKSIARLKAKGYINDGNETAAARHDLVAYDIPAGLMGKAVRDGAAAGAGAAVKISFPGFTVEITDGAGRETISGTIAALKELCL